MPTTQYATTVDGLSIAYQRFGTGDLDVVYLPGTVSHLETSWEVEGLRHWMERFASFCRFLKFDKRGTGLSDRSLGTGTPEARIDDVRAVMDAEGLERAVVLGHSEGGTLAALFAALHPDRVDRLVLYNAYSYGPLCDDHPKPESGRRAANAMLQRLKEEWGTGRAFSMGRWRRLAYWPMPSARLTATRNFWLPERKATLIARSPVARLNASRSSAFAEAPSPPASPERRM